MKIGHDLAEKKFVPGGVGVGSVGLVFSKFKEWSKPFNIHLFLIDFQRRGKA